MSQQESNATHFAPRARVVAMRARIGGAGIATRVALFAALIIAATRNAAAQQLPSQWGDYAQRLADARRYDQLLHSPLAEDVAAIPENFVPWWQAEVERPLRASASPVAVDVPRLVTAALANSWQVRVLGDTPAISNTAIVEAQATFDARAFVESKYINTNEPVGNTLTTGGPSRYRDSNWNSSGGWRRKLPTGGQVEVAQRFGYRNNNSVFLSPKDQATSRLALSFTQPLLNGAGTLYNQSVIVLAQLDAAVARDEYARQLQAHLYEVAQAYWALYQERAALAMRRKLFDEATKVLAELESRQTIDASPSQVLRARAAVDSRRVALVRAGASVENAETRLRVLVNDPHLQNASTAELLPIERPARVTAPVAMQHSLVMALEHRPEVERAFRELKSSSVRLQIAEKELLPYLAMLLETYVSGLRGEWDLGQSFVDQFSRGQPSYTAGLTLEMPLGNRAAKARWQKQQLERRQAINQLRNSVEQVLAEVEISVRDVATARFEMQGTYRAWSAEYLQLEELRHRWETMPGEEQLASFYLEDLLGVQQRVTDAELAFLQAQLNYHVALLNWKRATGTLLCEQTVEGAGALPLMPNAAPAPAGTRPVANPVSVGGFLPRQPLASPEPIRPGVAGPPSAGSPMLPWRLPPPAP